MNKQIFIINGMATCGKDTFVKLVRDHSRTPVIYPIDNKIEYYIQHSEIENYSSVSKVKKIAKIIGWDGTKTERDRKFLSDLKLLTTEYNDMPLNDMKDYAECFMNDDRLSMVNSVNNATCYGKPHLNRILFLHIREPNEIAKAVKAFEKYNAKAILVKRDSVKHITSNMADENVYNYDYDIVIENNGTLEDLANKAEQFINDCNNNTLKERY